MLQSVSSVFIVYRRKTLTGSPDPTHTNGMDKPCKNSWLKSLLLSTNEEILAEAIFDKVWGTGIPLH